MEEKIIELFSKENTPRIIRVSPTDDYKIYVYFSDDTIHLVDMKPSIQPGTVFEILRDKKFFRTRATIMNNTLAWDRSGKLDSFDCIDLAPEFLYEFPVVKSASNE